MINIEKHLRASEKIQSVNCKIGKNLRKVQCVCEDSGGDSKRHASKRIDVETQLGHVQPDMKVYNGYRGINQ